MRPRRDRDFEKGVSRYPPLVITDIMVHWYETSNTNHAAPVLRKNFTIVLKEDFWFWQNETSRVTIKLKRALKHCFTIAG